MNPLCTFSRRAFAELTDAYYIKAEFTVVSRNNSKGHDPCIELAKMARRGEADLTLLQESGAPPGEIAERFRYENDDLETDALDRSRWSCNCPTG